MHGPRRASAWAGTPARTPRQTSLVDHRLKNFEAEARRAFGFLVELGFTPTVQIPEDTDRRPIVLTVRFAGTMAAVEASLTLAFGGEDYVQTTISSVDGVRELTPHVARKGNEVRKALGILAEQTRTELTIG